MRAIDLMAALVLGDGRRWGDVAAPFQWEDARAILDDPSAPPYSLQTRSRGGSKTDDLAGMKLALMLTEAPTGARLFAVAADADQGRLIVESVEGFARRTPELAGAVEVNAYRVAVPRIGAVLEVLPADGPSVWGLRPWFVTVDELAAWPDTRGARGLWDAVTTAVAKVDGCRLVVLTTSGDPAHWSRRVLDHALADPLWRVHEVPGPAPWLDAAKLDEQRRRLPESLYLRLFENRWVASEDRLVSDEDLAACVVLTGPQPPVLARRYTIGLDVGLRRDRTVAAVCHLDAGVVTLDRLAVWEGTRLRPVKLTEVEEWLVRAAREYRADVTYDLWQAAQLTERLRKRGVRTREYTFSAASVGRLASTLFQLLHERALRLPDDAELLDELRNVRLREVSPGVMRMDHDAGRHDDRAIALALACQRLVERGETRPARVSVPRGRLPDPVLNRPVAGVELAHLLSGGRGR